MSDSAHAVMCVSLSLAVPMWIERLRARPWSYVEARAHECAQIIAEKGDVLQFKSKTKGETANAFNHLAEGLACLAFAPGGVKFYEMTFRAFHPESKRTPSRSLEDAVAKTVKRTPRKMP